jgi:hypothetical protein
MTTEAKPATIKADIMWAFLTSHNPKSDKYQVDLCNLSEAAVERLESMGITVGDKEGKGQFITVKSTRPIRAFNPEGDLIEGVLVGNGSKATAVVTYYDWPPQWGEGRSPSLVKLVITDLVVYEGANDVVEVDEAAAL